MARNSLETRLIEQGDIIIQLNKTILSLQQANAQALENFNAKEAALLPEIQKLREQNEYLTRKLFGKSSEKSSWDMEGQMNLFNELEKEQDLSLIEEEQEETQPVTFTVRKGRSADKDRYAGLPVERKYPDVPEEERFCPACSPDVKTPVIIQGKDGKSHMLHGMASASTVAWIMYQKYVNAMPLYRIEKDFKQYGVNITRATLANWVIQNTERFLSPFYSYLHRLLLNRIYIMADELCEASHNSSHWLTRACSCLAFMY